MVKLTPKEVAKIPKYSEESTKLSMEIIRLSKKRDLLNEKIGLLMRVTEFVSGHPINIRQHPMYSLSVDIRSLEDNDRSAHVYHNANVPDNEDKWGIRLEDGTYGGRYLGASFTSGEALDIAKNWVALGKQPVGY